MMMSLGNGRVMLSSRASRTAAMIEAMEDQPNP